MNDLIERLRHEAVISDRPGQMDRLNALADEFAAALEAAQAEVERLEEALRLIESAKDRGFGIDYARGVVQSALLRDQEEWK